MHSMKGNLKAQMLAQIKSLPEGEMKSALLDAYVKTVKSEQKGTIFFYTKETTSFLRSFL
jgi:hypothetical protein